MSSEKTVATDVVSQSYDIGSLLTLCQETVWAAQNGGGEAEMNIRLGAIQGALDMAYEKWGVCHDALEHAAKDSKPEAA